MFVYPYVCVYVYVYMCSQTIERMKHMYKIYMKHAYVLFKLNSWKDAIPFSWVSTWIAIKHYAVYEITIFHNDLQNYEYMNNYSMITDDVWWSDRNLYNIYKYYLYLMISIRLYQPEYNDKFYNLSLAMMLMNS